MVRKQRGLDALRAKIEAVNKKNREKNKKGLDRAGLTGQISIEDIFKLPAFKIK